VDASVLRASVEYEIMSGTDLIDTWLNVAIIKSRMKQYSVLTVIVIEISLPYTESQSSSL